MNAPRDGLAELGRRVHEALPQTTDRQRLDQRAAVIDRATVAGRGVGPAVGPRRWLAVGVGLGALAAASVVAVLAWPQEGMPERAPIARVLPSEQLAPNEGLAPNDRDVAAQAASTSTVLAPHADPVSDDVVDQVVDEVVLEEGTLALARGPARRVTVGPYAVEIRSDAACTLAWDPKQQTLDLSVTDGEVVLYAPTSHYTIVAGDRVHADAAEVVVTTAALERRPRRAGRTAAVPEWRRLAERGRYSDAMVEVEARGVFSGLAGLSRAELKLLADVARLGGAPSKSGAVLLRLRERFPKSREARRAAFYLGRQAEHDGHSAAAVRWYREYLASNRNGPWTQEVRGRLLRVLSRRGETESARAVAREYLRAHPDGAYAGPARELVAQ